MNSAHFSIRPFLESDAEQICELHVAAILATSDDYYSEAQRRSWASGKKPETYVRIARDEETYIVAVDSDDVPLGFCSYTTFEIKGLYVHPMAQGRGIGRALLSCAETVFREQRAKEIEIHSGLPAVSFYLAAGYTIVSRSIHRTQGGETLETVRFCKQLLD
jgi:GNAT superfamily N-acetyltransferase